MTKQGLLALILGILIIGAGAYFFLGTASPMDSKKETEILLYVDEGDVSYKLPGAVFVRATSSPVSIVTGTLVYTGIGKATVLFPNNSSVTLDTYTELAIAYEENKVSLLQTLGTTYHRVEKFLSGGTYEVETPGTLAAVRGTRFAVKYDKKKKMTKVAVTESEVEVSKLKTATGTTTREILESTLLPQGKTVHVEERATSTTSFTVLDTKNDKEMSDWVEYNRTRDEAQDSMKGEGKEPELIREEIKQLLETRPKTEETTQTKETTNKTADAKEEPESKPEAVRTEEKPAVPVTRTPAVKLDEEIFFDKFSAMFLNYFYLDEKDTPCGMEASPSERVDIVTSYAKDSGYPFQSTTLLSFAQEIESYCKAKKPEVKTRLQGRFDTEYPYQENI